MEADTEAIAVWALPDWPTWGAAEQAGLASDGPMAGWRKRLLGLGATWKRQLLVDAPLSPLRIGRQPEAADRRPLDEI
jgi:hypothetical protein